MNNVQRGSELSGEEKSLTFDALRWANMARLPHYKNAKGIVTRIHESWLLSQWANAMTGEVGEAANLIKKVDRGDFTLDEVREELGKELADIQTYLDILAYRAGIDLGKATITKFNEVSVRIDSPIRLTPTYIYSFKVENDDMSYKPPKAINI